MKAFQVRVPKAEKDWQGTLLVIAKDISKVAQRYPDALNIVQKTDTEVVIIGRDR